MKTLTSLIVLVCTSQFSFAQFFNNPSFEGQAWSSFIFDTDPCHGWSTPDVMPGPFGVTKSPSHGNTYMCLVTRGNAGPYANTTEDVSINLNKPFEKGKTYELSFDIARSDEFGHDGGSWGWVSYTTPAKLLVYGANNNCWKDELVWESTAIANTNWKTQTIVVKPQNTNFNYMYLKAQYATMPEYFGSILIDNMKAEEIIDPPVVLDTLLIPNIYTPNGDGLNDVFNIENIPPNTQLRIYSRWGNLVYEKRSYANNWTGMNQVGDPLADGTYFYVLTNEKAEKPLNGYVLIQR